MEVIGTFDGCDDYITFRVWYPAFNQATTYSLYMGQRPDGWTQMLLFEQMLKHSRHLFWGGDGSRQFI